MKPQVKRVVVPGRAAVKKYKMEKVYELRVIQYQCPKCKSKDEFWEQSEIWKSYSNGLGEVRCSHCGLMLGVKPTGLEVLAQRFK